MAISEALFAYVVDANVVLKLYFEQAGSDKVRALFASSRAGDTHFFAPDLLYAECANVFSIYAGRGGYTRAEARQDLAKLMGLGLHVIPISELAMPALEISLRHRVTGYDACYVALAERLAVPLITADEKLLRALAGQSYPIESLAMFTPPSL